MRNFGDTEGFGSDLLKHHWRKSPVVAKNVINSKIISRFSEENFLSWADKTSGAMRVFENKSNGDSRSGLLNPKSARRYYKLFRDAKSAFTFHMNDVELVDPVIFNLRQSFGIPFWWRLDDVISTLSTPESGIGYHAGHEDGIIVQLYGSRRWRVWKESFTPIEYRYQLLAPIEGPNPRISRPHLERDILLDVQLFPGDVLYIPPYFPHEGVTINTSVSLSVAWKGIGPASFLPNSIFKDAAKIINSEILRKSTILFEECFSANEAIHLWQSKSVNTMPECLREGLLDNVHTSIERHVLNLAQRYCNS
ncbi:JmjC domain-containing protein [Pseudomonas sp. 9AZ]|uniref:JmjC domain-containing protein n=1 Tax=Pseudomonas sp. 9AZ TaxID=2653168 RepID=UPI0013572ECF|nr:cupin domain-containing protein [Pseudomonas sp. 9AZ]